jgi:two-component system sensor histidine kinase YesM
MEAKTVTQLAAQLETDYKIPVAHENRDSIGLKNVHDRIRYRYGAPYGITIESAPGTGSVILLRLPLRYTEVPHV